MDSRINLINNKKRTSKASPFLIENKKGAVSTYRFLAMYIFIGLIVGTITLIYQDTNNTSKGYNLEGEQARVNEIGNQKDTLIEQSDQLVKANQLSFTSGWGNENGFGRNWVEVIYKGFLPSGLIPSNYTPTPIEQEINWVIIIFRSIILIFAGFEIYQAIINKKTT